MMGRMLCTGSELGLSVHSTRARSCGSWVTQFRNSCRPPAAKTLTRTPSVCRDGGLPVAGSQVKSGRRTEQEAIKSRWKEGSRGNPDASPDINLLALMHYGGSCLVKVQFIEREV